MNSNTFVLVFVCNLAVSTVPSSLAASSCTDCIVVDYENGRDDPVCLYSFTPGCKTLTYALSNASSLNNSVVYLEGDHQLGQTLTVQGVANLTIKAATNNSVIHCSQPSSHQDIGSGLVFQYTSNISVINVTFEGCGTLQYSTTLRNNENLKSRSAVYLINCTGVIFSHCRFHKNVARGLSLYDVIGRIEVIKSEFYENKVVDDEKNVHFGGGSIYIEFTYCSPGFPNCNRDKNTHNSNSKYVIRDCLFENNVATSNEISDQINIVQFRVLAGNDGNNAGEGGGIHITLKGISSNNTIEVHNCTFRNNTATYGGGIGAIFQDLASESTLLVKDSNFYNNYARERGGGALQLGFVNTEKETHNRIIVQDTEFVGNSAGWGGAVAFFVSRSRFDVNNTISFFNCTFIENSASIGAAMLLKPEARDSIFDGLVPTPFIENCTYVNNRVVYTAALLNIANDGESQHVLQSGTVDIESIIIDLSQIIVFVGNRGSAIVAKSAQVNVLQSTRVVFVNNTATNGGAMALLGFSVVELYSGSQVVFDSNHASELGGAVYATSPHQTEYIFSHRCFFSCIYIPNPNKWNTSLTFANNTAKYGFDIYTDSLLTCAKHVGNVSTELGRALKWRPFNYTSGIKEYTIATSPAAIQFTLPPELAPGQRVDIHPLAMDDLNQTIPSGYQVFLESTGDATTNNYLSDDGYLQIRGKPGTVFNLTLQTQNTRLVSVVKAGQLDDCPLGFSLEVDDCICSASKPEKKLFGIDECDLSNFLAFLQLGYWAGCVDSGKPATGYCPPDYCDYQNATGGHKSVVPKSCSKTDDQRLCTPHRKGPICGDCEEGYAVLFHSESFGCDECEYGAVGLVFYVLAELLPLVLVFAIIMIMKLKLTSGLMQSMLLFAQTISFINQTPSVIAISKTSTFFTRLHSFLLGFLSLRFFYVDVLSFCLWKGATVLQNLTFNYITSLATLLILGLYILLVNKVPLGTRGNKTVCFGRIIKFIEDKQLFKNSIVHGISTFLILSYTQYTVTSFQILSRLSLYGEGERTIRSVVRLQGSVEYFGVDHLPYAIPAVLVLVFLSLPPPLLLISYPLLWKIKAKLRRNVETDNDTTVWPIRKLLPLIDSFQGVFRDNCRMFAGLLFLWRVILTAIFAFSTNLTDFFLLTDIALLTFLIIHIVARPHKQRIYNIIDPLMLVNMAIINSLSWFVFAASTETGASGALEAVDAIKLVLMYLPIALLAAYVSQVILRKSGLLRIKFKFSSSEESPVDNLDFPHRKNKQKDSCNDEDLFARAAETRPPALILSVHNREGFTLETTENPTATEVLTDMITNTD